MISMSLRRKNMKVYIWDCSVSFYISKARLRPFNISFVKTLETYWVCRANHQNSYYCRVHYKHKWKQVVSLKWVLDKKRWISFEKCPTVYFRGKDFENSFNVSCYSVRHVICQELKEKRMQNCKIITINWRLNETLSIPLTLLEPRTSNYWLQ